MCLLFFSLGATCTLCSRHAEVTRGEKPNLGDFPAHTSLRITANFSGVKDQGVQYPLAAEHTRKHRRNPSIIPCIPRFRGIRHSGGTKVQADPAPMQVASATPATLGPRTWGAPAKTLAPLRNRCRLLPGIFIAYSLLVIPSLLTLSNNPTPPKIKYSHGGTVLYGEYLILGEWR